MHVRPLALILVLCGIAPVAMAQGPPAPMTLAEAQDRALTQASALTQAEHDVRAAEEDVKQAATGFLPVFTAPLSYVYVSPMRGIDEHGVPAFISEDAINHYFLLANAEGTIDVNGKLRAELDRTRADLARARATALVARRGLLSAVSDAYYGLALSRGKRQIAEETLQSAREFLDTTKLLFEGGEVAELDTLKAEIDVTTRTDELLQARAAEQEAADTFNTLEGLDVAAPTTVQEIGVALPMASELDGLVADLIAQRPEFAQFDAEARSADAEARAAKADRLPSLTYSVRAGVDDSRIDPSRDLGAAAVVTLNVPIFDWGASRSRQRQAEIKRDATKRNRELAERTLRQQFSTARAQAELAAQRVRLTGAGLATATRALDISVARYRAGEAPVLEVIDARKTLADERAAYYQAIFDYRVSLDRLRQAVGR